MRWTNINLPPGTTEGFQFYITDNNGTRKANTGGMAANATFTLQIVPIPVPTYTISGTVTFMAPAERRGGVAEWKRERSQIDGLFRKLFVHRTVYRRLCADALETRL